MISDRERERLRRLQHATSSTPADDRRTCPACGSPNTRDRGRPADRAGGREHPERYACRRCGHYFDDVGE